MAGLGDRQDAFKIRKFRRVYDRARDRFNFYVEYQTHTEPTPRSLVVAEAFGLGIDEDQKFPVLNAELKISPKDVVLITGDSGSGKSVLLRAIRQDLGAEAVDMADIVVDDNKPLIETIGALLHNGEGQKLFGGHKLGVTWKKLRERLTSAQVSGSASQLG